MQVCRRCLEELVTYLTSDIIPDICDLFGPALFDRSENNCYLYGVFNGYDGNRVTNFVGQRLSAELLLGQLRADHSDADVRRVLLQVK